MYSYTYMQTSAKLGSNPSAHINNDIYLAVSYIN